MLTAQSLLLLLLLLLSLVGAAAAAMPTRPLPRWDYNNSALSLGWFGANRSGYENSAQLAQISRYSMAIFGWQAFLDATNYTHEAQELVLQAQRVKDVDPAIPVAIYLDAELAEPFQASVQSAMTDPALSDFWLKDKLGRIMTCNVFCRSMPGMSKTDPRCLAYYWNWFNRSAVQYYLHSYVEPLVKLQGFDAVFFDGADEWMEQSRHTWKVASNVPLGANDSTGLQAMMDVRVQTAQLLVKYGKYPLISEHLGDTSPAQQAYVEQRMEGVGYFRYFEFFSPTQAYIEAILNETQRRPAGARLPIMCRQLIDRWLDLTDSIAAFLIIAGNYSYYSASTGWFDKDWSWHPEYTKYQDVGDPLGPAVTHGGGMYSRSYRHADVALNCSVGRGKCRGLITLRKM